MNRLLRAALIPFALPFRTRFTAGTTRSNAIRAAQNICSQNVTPIINYLGEHLESQKAVQEHVTEYSRLIFELPQQGRCRVSIKPSQIGLDIPAYGLCHARTNILRLIEAARPKKIALEIDMEDAARADPSISLAIFANRMFLTRTRVALSARMHESEKHARILCRFKVPLRLVKGAYEDTPDISLQKMSAVRERYKEMASYLLIHGTYPAFATHDNELIEHVRTEAERLNIPKESFEFQFLKGFRPRMQKRLAKQGYGVAVYIPYGPLWLEYGIRRWTFFCRNPKHLLLALFG